MWCARSRLRTYNWTAGNRGVLFMDESHGVQPGGAPSAAPGQANRSRRALIRPLTGSALGAIWLPNPGRLTRNAWVGVLGDAGVAAFPRRVQPFSGSAATTKAT